MDKLTRQFFGDAKKMKLSCQEKAQVWNQISTTVASKHVALTGLEKADAFDRIAAHMRSHPISQPRSRFFLFHKFTASAVVATLIVGVFGGGAAYAAEDALPDDLLYPVKIHVNEPVIGLLQRTPEKRAQWETRRLERRMREAEHLSAREHIPAEHLEVLKTHMQQRLTQIEQHLANLPEDQQELLRTRLDEKFAKHEEFFEKLEDGSVEREDVRAFKHHVHSLRSRARKHGRREPPLSRDQQLPSRIPPREQINSSSLPSQRLPKVRNLLPNNRIKDNQSGRVQERNAPEIRMPPVRQDRPIPTREIRNLPQVLDKNRL